MARDLLSKLDDWDLVYEEQDVRGRDVYDDAGTKLGEVKDMVADTDAARVVALVLDNGQQYDADLVEIGDDRVLVHTSGAASTVGTERETRRYSDYEGAHVRPRTSTSTSDTYAGGTVSGTDAGVGTGSTISGAEASFGAGTAATGAAYTAARDAGLGEDRHVSGTDGGAYGGLGGTIGSSSNPVGAASYDDLSDDDRYFRDYHRTTYGDDDYDTYAPAYRSGTQYGRRTDWNDRDWDVLEPDMRRDYETHHGEGAWERFKDYVRAGFQRARNAVTGGDDGNRSTAY